MDLRTLSLPMNFGIWCDGSNLKDTVVWGGLQDLFFAWVIWDWPEQEYNIILFDQSKPTNYDTTQRNQYCLSMRL